MKWSQGLRSANQSKPNNVIGYLKFYYHLNTYFLLGLSMILIWLKALSFLKALLFLAQADPQIEEASNAILKIGIGSSLAIMSLFFVYKVITQLIAAFQKNSEADNYVVAALADILKTVAGPLEVGVKSLETAIKNSTEEMSKSTAVQAALIPLLKSYDSKITDLEGSSSINRVLIEKHDEFSQNAVKDLKKYGQETLDLVKALPDQFGEIKKIQSETNQQLDGLKVAIIAQIELVRNDVNEKCERVIKDTVSESSAT